MEREANEFALALLMPKERFLSELNKQHFDLSDENDKSLEIIAKKFGVSINAVAYRMKMLCQ